MSNSAPDLPLRLDASRDKPDKGLHKARNEPVLCTVYSIKPPSFSTIRYSTKGRNKIMSRSNQVRYWDIPVHMKRRNPVRARQSAQDPAGTWTKGICFSSPPLSCNRDASWTGLRRYQCSRYCLSRSAGLALRREANLVNHDIYSRKSNYQYEYLDGQPHAERYVLVLYGDPMYSV